MKRRTFVGSLGALAAGGSAVLGTGAFTSVSASRSLTVEVADDNDALLALSELGEGSDGKGGRSQKGGDTVSFSFPGVGRRLADPDLGLGTDSVYEFDRDSGEADAADPERGLLRVENRGTQPVDVHSEFPDSSQIDVELFDVSDPDRTALRDDPAELGVGEFVDVGFRISTDGADIGTFDETLTVVAEQPTD
jgi:hypothetical protein